MKKKANNKIIIGKFGKVYGIKGWLRIISFTDPQEKILEYRPWYIKKTGQWQEIYPEGTARRAPTIIVKLSSIDTPESAKKYTNLDIYIKHEQLPKLPEGEYYWSDLEGLTVINKFGKKLGIVDHLIATGSNDVLVVVRAVHEPPLLIPYINNVILQIDLEEKIIKVDWELE